MARTHVPYAGPRTPSAASSSPTDCVSAVSERRQRLVQDNLGFVIKVASEYRNLGLPVEDLISEGSLGLMEAAVRYDPGRGAKFVTYAAAWVRKSILRALSQNTRTIRIPPYHQDQLKRYQRAEALLSFQLGRRPDRAEVSRRLDSPGGALFRWSLLSSLRPKCRHVARRYPGLLDPERVLRIRTIAELDRWYTAPLHGFADEEDYYARSSCLGYLPGIRVPTLLLSAADDPIVPASTFPDEAVQGSPWLTGELLPRGGHVGFVSGRSPRSPVYWAEGRAAAFLAGCAGEGG